ncbi:hypothetical protein L7F22_006362 [Adiantum nelumboides]|nr:hypothetical protein [Adiantum nelumboides]
MMKFNFWIQFWDFFRLQHEKRELRGIFLVVGVSALALILFSFYIPRGSEHSPSLLSNQYAGHLDFLRSHQLDATALHLRPARTTSPANHTQTKKSSGHPNTNQSSIDGSSSEKNGSSTSNNQVELETEARQTENHERCQGKYVYIYKLPPEFNEDLVEKCGRATDDWVPLCGNLNNNGYGPSIPTSSFHLNESDIDSLIELVPPHAWYRTEQFSLEVIFHERLRKGYPCLTEDTELASAFYIPYYAALDTAFTLFKPHLATRDRLAQRLIGWLRGSEVWTKFQGIKKHFMVLGRVAWDLARKEEVVDGWGSSLLSQVELSNVTMLLIERRSWVSNEIAIPYPTSFHPSSSLDVELWQAKLRERMSKRSKLLSSFIGSTSRGSEWSRALRVELAKQCNQAGANTCQAFKCGDGTFDCARNPEHVNALFLSSTFCLQPSGDSPTRKGIFDSLLAGCIPVLFNEASAYTQYYWHLPQNGSLYSVLFNGEDVIHRNVDIFATLAVIANDTQRLRRMQEEIINMLPHIVYSLSTSNDGSDTTFHDAVDVALESLFTGAPIPTM